MEIQLGLIWAFIIAFCVSQDQLPIAIGLAIGYAIGCLLAVKFL